MYKENYRPPGARAYPIPPERIRTLPRIFCMCNDAMTVAVFMTPEILTPVLKAYAEILNYPEMIIFLFLSFKGF